MSKDGENSAIYGSSEGILSGIISTWHILKFYEDDKGSLLYNLLEGKMYLKKLMIRNFRNFREENNQIEFVSSEGIQQSEKINVAAVTTLIVGKNNAGKTTIISALDKLINTKVGGNIFSSNDFNFDYLQKCLENYVQGTDKKAPKLEFVFTIGLEDGNTDLLTNIVPFMLLEDVSDSELDISVRYEVVEEEKYFTDVNEVVEKYKDNEKIMFQKYLKCLDELSYKVRYYDKNDEEVERSFKIGNLMDIKVIKANNLKTETNLSDSFNKIIEYRYKKVQKSEREALENKFDNINETIHEAIKKDQTEDINKAVGKMVTQTAMEVDLRADVTLDKVISSLIKYEYVENGQNIPENQFGLGYTNLMMIVASLLDYMEKYPDTAYNSKINLISIEEPETYMHPQMQELFITNINAVIDALRISKNKSINSQLIVTTHSSHILNSKIHSGNSFDNINYVYKKNYVANVSALNNTKVMPVGVDKESAEFKFLKKHIKYKVSELFFSDAVIFVEGFAEETLLPFFIDNREKMNRNYISIFGINGAHAHLYQNLLKTLKVPALVITDLDIKKIETEDVNAQITTLTGRETTNKTIMHFSTTQKDISSIGPHIEDDNIYLAYQGEIEGYFATSFEEALILTNYNNNLLNEVLKETRKSAYNAILGATEDYTQNKLHSKLWQNELGAKKGEFASNLLFAMSNEEDNSKLPKVPEYIENGFIWLENELNKGC